MKSNAGWIKWHNIRLCMIPRCVQYALRKTPAYTSLAFRRFRVLSTSSTLLRHSMPYPADTPPRNPLVHVATAWVYVACPWRPVFNITNAAPGHASCASGAASWLFEILNCSRLRSSKTRVSFRRRISVVGLKFDVPVLDVTTVVAVALRTTPFPWQAHDTGR